MDIFQLIWLYITDRRAYVTAKRNYLRQQVMLRHEAMKRHVYIQDVYKYNPAVENNWELHSYICLDDDVICEYTLDKEDFFAELYDRYYIRHRHELLTRRQ